LKVDLIAYTPEPLRVLWTAARTCYSPKTPQELWEEYPEPEKAAVLLNSLWRRGHQSVFEHVSLTYAVSGVSRVLLAQYSRHRIGVSLSVQSQRHVSANGNFFVVPPKIVELLAEPKNQHVKDAWFEANRAIRWAYAVLVGAGIKKEDARFIMPQAVATNFVTTVNLRSLAHLYKLRVMGPGAQWEIRNLVCEMMRLAQEAVPKLGAILQEKGVWW
jgi:thymidylate synthase (FAD)